MKIENQQDLLAHIGEVNLKSGACRLGLALMQQIESDTVEFDGNVRTKHSEAATADIYRLMINGEWTLDLQNSSVCLYRLPVEGHGNKLVDPEGLTRIRAGIRYATENDQFGPDMTFIRLDRKSFEAAQKYADTNRGRSLTIRVQLKDQEGDNLPKKINARAVTLTKYLAGIDVGIEDGTPKASPQVIEQVFGRYMSSILKVVTNDVLYRAKVIKRPCVLSAVVRIDQRSPKIGDLAIAALCSGDKQHGSKPLATLNDWLTRPNQDGNGSQLMRRLYRGVTYCLAKLLKDGHASMIGKVQVDRDYLAACAKK